MCGTLCGDGCAVCSCGADYTAAQAQAAALFQINARDGAVAGSPANKKAYIDIRGALADSAAITKAVADIAKAGSVDNIFVVSLGDEIAVAGGDTSASTWTAWCAGKATAAQGCGGGRNVSALGIADAKGDAATNGYYYWSTKFVHAAAIVHFKAMSTQLQAALPNANVGANFAPTAYMTDPRDGQQYCHNCERMTALSTFLFSMLLSLRFTRSTSVKRSVKPNDKCRHHYLRRPRGNLPVARALPAGRNDAALVRG